MKTSSSIIIAAIGTAAGVVGGIFLHKFKKQIKTALLGESVDSNEIPYDDGEVVINIDPTDDIEILYAAGNYDERQYPSILSFVNSGNFTVPNPLEYCKVVVNYTTGRVKFIYKQIDNELDTKAVVVNEYQLTEGFPEKADIAKDEYVVFNNTRYYADEKMAIRFSNFLVKNYTKDVQAESDRMVKEAQEFERTQNIVPDEITKGVKVKYVIACTDEKSFLESKSALRVNMGHEVDIDNFPICQAIVDYNKGYIVYMENGKLLNTISIPNDFISMHDEIPSGYKSEGMTYYNTFGEAKATLKELFSKTKDETTE